MIGDADQSEARPRHHASHPTTSRTPEHRVPAQAQCAFTRGLIRAHVVVRRIAVARRKELRRTL
jgi:hypothetical protein